MEATLVDADLQDACVLQVGRQERAVLEDVDAFGDREETVNKFLFKILLARHYQWGPFEFCRALRDWKVGFRVFILSGMHLSLYVGPFIIGWNLRARWKP